MNKLQYLYLSIAVALSAPALGNPSTSVEKTSSDIVFISPDAAADASAAADTTATATAPQFDQDFFVETAHALAIDIPDLRQEIKTLSPDVVFATDINHPHAIDAHDGDTAKQAHVRNGWDIVRDFSDGLATPSCTVRHPRWENHFQKHIQRLAEGDDATLALFGYVVDTLRANGLPTEYALIPFVESSYHPDARSSGGPMGMWQFITTTARNHDIEISRHYDGRLSPVESTRAATQYLQTLHTMFGGDWRLAAMGYNAGEYRILRSIRQSGVGVANAEPGSLHDIPAITRAYVEKMQALTCVLDTAANDPQWRAGVDRAIPRLTPQALPEGIDFATWAQANDQDPRLLAHWNPLAAQAPAARRTPLVVLAPMPGVPVHVDTWDTIIADDPVVLAAVAPSAAATVPTETSTPLTASTSTALAPTSVHRETSTRSEPPLQRHTVKKGESAWTIAQRYGVELRHLLSVNGLNHRATLQPGMILKLH